MQRYRKNILELLKSHSDILTFSCKIYPGIFDAMVGAGTQSDLFAKELYPINNDNNTDINEKRKTITESIFQEYMTGVLCDRMSKDDSFKDNIVTLWYDASKD